MSHSGLRTVLAFSVLSLAACAQKADLHQIQHEIKALNQNMLALSQQAVTLSRQNALNSQSTQGVYLLPDSGAPALLESQIGVLKMSLTDVTGSSSGTHITLQIQENDRKNLPTFTGTIEWKTTPVEGASDVATGHQAFTAPPHLASPDEATIVLTLPDVTPATLHWVRIHDIHALTEPTDQPAP